MRSGIPNDEGRRARPTLKWPGISRGVHNIHGAAATAGMESRRERRGRQSVFCEVKEEELRQSGRWIRRGTRSFSAGEHLCFTHVTLLVDIWPFEG